MLGTSVLDVLGNARTAAKDARQQLLREVAVSGTRDRSPARGTAGGSNNVNNSMSVVEQFERGGSATPRRRSPPQQQSRARPLSAIHRPLDSTTLPSQGSFLVTGATPTSKQTSGRNTPRTRREQQIQDELAAKTAVSDKDIQWMEFVATISDKEQAAATFAAHMKIEDIDEHGQLETDFLSGLDEEAWDFDSDLFTGYELDGSRRNIHNNQSNQHHSAAAPAAATSSHDGSVVQASLAGAAMMTDLASPETRRKTAERATFWTLRRIIEKLQHRVKSVVQQRDSYKTLLGRYSYCASELHSAAKRCDAATTVLSDRYRRVVAHEMGGREIKPAYPPGTVLFGHAGSQQGKELELATSMASFSYPIDGHSSFVVSQPFFVEEPRSIVTPQNQQGGGGLGIPARGVDWDIVGDLEKDAANAVSATHDEELRHLSEQLKAAYRRHCRDIRTVATMRRGVMDALDHAKQLEGVISERDATIDHLKAELTVRDKTIEQERETANKLKAQIQELVNLRSELDEELGRAGDNEHDLAEKLKELKQMMASNTQQREREAAQRREESHRLRTAMLDFGRELDGAVNAWRKQWKDIKIKSQQQAREEEEEEDRKRMFDNPDNNTNNAAQVFHASGVFEATDILGAHGGIEAYNRKQQASMIDFSNQWIVVNEMFEQKRVDLSSRCNPEQVQTWNHIFKAVNDLWHFSKQVQESLKARDDRLQNQFSMFEEQLRPILFELRQVDEAAQKDGKGGGSESRGAGGPGSSVFSMMRALNRMKRGSEAGGGSGGESTANALAMALAAKRRDPLEIRKEVVDGLERLKQFVGNFEQDELSPVIRSFTNLFSEMFLRNDTLWSEEHGKVKSELDETKKKLAETQMQLSIVGGSNDELKKSVEELRSQIAEMNKKRNAYHGVGGAGGGAGGGTDDWSELCPPLAASLDSLDARFDSVRSAVSRGVAPVELIKLRADVVEDLEHFDRSLKAIIKDSTQAAFPDGFVPISCLAKILSNFLHDARWMHGSVSHAAGGLVRNMNNEAMSLLQDLRKARHTICTQPPSSTLVESRFMRENELALRAKNSGNLGVFLRRVLSIFESISSSVVNVQRSVTGGALLSGVDVSASFSLLNAALHAAVEELQTTVVAGSLGQWPTVHRSLISAAADPAHSLPPGFTASQVAAATAEMAVDENAGKIGGHSSLFISALMDQALESVLGPAPVQHQHQHHSSTDNSTAPATLIDTVPKKPVEPPQSLEQALSRTDFGKVDAATARLLIARFEEIVLCRSGMAAPFIEPNLSGAGGVGGGGSSGGGGGEHGSADDEHTIAQLQNENRQLLAQLQQLQSQPRLQFKGFAPVSQGSNNINSKVAGMQMQGSKAPSSSQRAGGSRTTQHQQQQSALSSSQQQRRRSLSPGEPSVSFVGETGGGGDFKKQSLRSGSTGTRRGSSNNANTNLTSPGGNNSRRASHSPASRTQSGLGTSNNNNGEWSFNDPSQLRPAVVETKERGTQMDHPSIIIDDIYAAANYITTGFTSTAAANAVARSQEDRLQELNSDPNRISAPMFRRPNSNAIHNNALPRSTHNREITREEELIVVDMAAQTDPALLRILMEQAVAAAQQQWNVQQSALLAEREDELNAEFEQRIAALQEEMKQELQKQGMAAAAAAITEAASTFASNKRPLSATASSARSAIAAAAAAVGGIAPRPGSATTTNSSMAVAGVGGVELVVQQQPQERQQQQQQTITSARSAESSDDNNSAAAATAALLLEQVQQQMQATMTTTVTSSRGGDGDADDGTSGGGVQQRPGSAQSNMSATHGSLRGLESVSARQQQAPQPLQQQLSSSSAASSPRAQSGVQQQQQQPHLSEQLLLSQQGNLSVTSANLNGSFTAGMAMLNSPSSVLSPRPLLPLPAGGGDDGLVAGSPSPAMRPLSNISFGAMSATCGAAREKPQQATRAVQVAMDAVQKPPHFERAAQTDHTTSRQFVTSVHVTGTMPGGGVGGVTAAVQAKDHHRPSDWVPAEWKKTEQNTVVLPDAPPASQLGHMSLVQQSPAGYSRPPTPVKAEAYYGSRKSLSPSGRPQSAPSISVEERDVTVRQWRIHGGGGAMFVLKLERPKWAASQRETAEADEMRRFQRHNPPVPWQPSTDHLFHVASNTDDDDASTSRTRSTRRSRPSSPVEELHVRHRRIDSPSSPKSPTQRLYGVTSVFDVSQQLARELQQLTASSTTRTPQQDQQQQQAQQFDVERTREMSYLRRRIEEANNNNNNNNNKQQLHQDAGTAGHEAVQGSIKTIHPISALQTPQHNRSQRPMSAAQLRVQKQYEQDGLVYSPPPTAIENSYDAEFCRKVGLTPQGVVRSNPTAAQLLRPDSPAKAKVMANANGGVFMSRAVERELQKKKEMQLQRDRDNNSNIIKEKERKQREEAQQQQQHSKQHELPVGIQLQRELLLTPQVIRRNPQPEERGSSGSGLRSDEQTKQMGLQMQELGCDPQSSKEVQARRREFGQLSSLATSLCGPGSLLARRLSAGAASSSSPSFSVTGQL